jgi:hypothetical protein
LLFFAPLNPVGSGAKNHLYFNNFWDFSFSFPQHPRSRIGTGLIVKSERLGGLLKYYHRESETEAPKAA